MPTTGEFTLQCNARYTVAAQLTGPPGVLRSQTTLHKLQQRHSWRPSGSEKNTSTQPAHTMNYFAA